jgi:hypothetical protein
MGVGDLGDQVTELLRVQWSPCERLGMTGGDRRAPGYLRAQISMDWPW